MLSIVEGGNKDPNKLPSRTKYGESWSIGTVNLYIEKYPEDTEYTEVSVEDFIGSQSIQEGDRVVEGTIGTGNMAIACILTRQWYHGYTQDLYLADLVLERLESRLGVRAERVRARMDLRFQ